MAKLERILTHGLYGLGLVCLGFFLLKLSHETTLNVYKVYTMTNFNMLPIHDLRIATSPVKNATRVTVTCYNSDPKQTDSTPYLTAFQTKVRPGIIAVSRDLLARGYGPHSKVYLEGFGEFTVEDTMHERFKNRVDVWVPKHVKPFKKDNVLLVSYRTK